jgi:hypothetical protein
MTYSKEYASPRSPQDSGIIAIDLKILEQYILMFSNVFVGFFFTEDPSPNSRDIAPRLQRSLKLLDILMLNTNLLSTPIFPSKLRPTPCLDTPQEGSFIGILSHLKVSCSFSGCCLEWSQTERRGNKSSIYGSKRRDYLSFVPGTSKFIRMSMI